MKQVTSQQGAVLLFTVLIIGLASVALMSVIATAGLNSFADSEQQVTSMTVRAKLFGCLNELLIEINGDPDLNPTSIETLDATCAVSLVQEGGDDRSGDISLTEGDITRSLHVEMSVNGVQLTSLIEQ
ncbi:hypothetical protein EPN81_02945 [Patescibacteria group bacterium]|nr:MAG: hypothetical protein EPN81_02945 [Patescibacteria group bacterium]